MTFSAWAMLLVLSRLWGGTLFVVEADGCFVYAVRTTGIYGRPSCRSKLPQPGNVTFFETASEAEAGGFRPCKRCRPNGTVLDVTVKPSHAACKGVAKGGVAL